MIEPTRRLFLAGSGLTAAFGLAGCNSTQSGKPNVAANTPGGSRMLVADIGQKPNATGPVPEQSFDSGPSRYQALYGEVPDKFPIPALKPGVVQPAFWRADVDYNTNEPAGTIVIDPRQHYLYHVKGGGKATRYGVGVGREGFGWHGIASINSKQEWPDWYPPKEMIERQPDIQKVVTKLQSGIGLPGGPRNPLGARAMYLWQNNKDTLFRIHGTLEPWTIGSNVSSGCIRMVNQDAIHLYNETQVGTRVVVI